MLFYYRLSLFFPRMYCTLLGNNAGKEREVVIQGHLAAEVEAMLIDVCGIPKHLVESKLAKGVKPKKQHR